MTNLRLHTPYYIEKESFDTLFIHIFLILDGYTTD